MALAVPGIQPPSTAATGVLTALMITLFAFLVRTREFSILPTPAVIALSVVCLAAIALSLRSEFRRNR
jgi:hypothetical protein